LTTEWIERDGVALRYQLSGSGPGNVVLVHEMGGTLESWDDVVPTLAGRAAVLRYDTRGAGQSVKLRGTADIDAMASDIATLLDAVGLTSPAVVVGIAVGGAIALRFAARYPSRTRGVLVFGPATGVAAERRDGLLAHAAHIAEAGMAEALETDLGRAYPTRLRTDPAGFARYRARWLSNDPGSYAAIYRMLVGLDMRADLAALRCPVLAIAGLHDPLRPPALVEAVANQIPGAQFAKAETGHYAAVQTPELVADLIGAFLDRLDAEGDHP
jgi:3-oxoadipate enol-lactonase